MTKDDRANGESHIKPIPLVSPPDRNFRIAIASRIWRITKNAMRTTKMLILARLWLVKLVLLVLLGLIPRPAHGRDVVLVIDYSSSMNENDPFGYRLEMSALAVDSALEQDRIAVVAFAGLASVSVPVTPVSDRVKADICIRLTKPPKLPDGTDILAALNEAKQCLGDFSQPTEVILLTDGVMNRWTNYKLANDGSRDEPKRQALLDAMLAPFEKAKVPIHAIALGREANTKLLRAISQRTDGQYFPLTTPDQLPATYLQLLAGGKGMVAVQGANFYVWPGSKEVDVVLFRPRKGDSSFIQSIQGPTKNLVPGSDMSYWSKARNPPPFLYDFTRIAEPEGGDMSVVVQGGGELQIHALQAVPFEVQIVSPARDSEKMVIGAPMIFKVELIPRTKDAESVIEAVAEMTDVTARLQYPDKSVKVLAPMQRTGKALFVSSEQLQAVTTGDDYQVFITARFRSKKGMPWMIEKNRLFRVAEPDFALALRKPVNGVSLPSPLSILEVAFAANKLDTKGVFSSPPIGTRIKIDVRDGNGRTIQQKEADLEKGAGQINLGDSISVLLAPGKYRLRISATHETCSFKADEVLFAVEDWPPPKLDGLMARLAWPTLLKVKVGEAVSGIVELVDSQGRQVKFGSQLDQSPTWSVKSTSNWSLEATEPNGRKRPIAVKPISEFAGTFEYIPVWSGTHTAKGSVQVSIDSMLAGQKPDPRKESLTVQGKPLQVPPRVEITPTSLDLSVSQVTLQATGQLHMTTWFPEKETLVLRVIPTVITAGEEALPADWCILSDIIVPPADPANAATGAANSVTVMIKVPEKSGIRARFGTYRAQLVAARSEAPSVPLATIDLCLRLSVAWPDVKDFAIQHDIPERFEGNVFVFVYENQLSAAALLQKQGGKTNKFATWLALRDKPSATLAKGRTVAERFTVIDLQWSWSDPWGSFREETDEQAPYATLELLEGKPPMVAPLRVSKLVLGLPDSPGLTNEYRDITSQVSITCAKPKL